MASSGQSGRSRAQLGCFQCHRKSRVAGRDRRRSRRSRDRHRGQRNRTIPRRIRAAHHELETSPGRHRRRHHQVGKRRRLGSRPRDCSGGGGGRVDSVEPDVDSGVRRIRRHAPRQPSRCDAAATQLDRQPNRESHLYAGSSRAGICGLGIGVNRCCHAAKDRNEENMVQVRCLTRSSKMKITTPNAALATPDSSSRGQLHAICNPTMPRAIMK